MVYWLRWKLWEIASHIAFLMCPDKNALNLVMRLGLDKVKDIKEGQEIDDFECADDQETRVGDAA